MKGYGAYLACLIAAIFINLGFASQLKSELATAQRLQQQMLEHNKVFDGEIVAMTVSMKAMTAAMKELSVQVHQVGLMGDIIWERVELALTPEQRQFAGLRARLNKLEARGK